MVIYVMLNSESSESPKASNMTDKPSKKTHKTHRPKVFKFTQAMYQQYLMDEFARDEELAKKESSKPKDKSSAGDVKLPGSQP